MTVGIDNANDSTVRETSQGSTLETLDSLFNNDAPEVESEKGIEPQIDTNVSESEAEPKSEEAAVQEALNKLRIKANGKEHEFILDPENAELIEALEYGVAGKKSFSKANKLVADAKNRISELEKKYANYNDVSTKAKTIDEITSLIEKGYTDEAVKALLGDKYEDFKRDEIISTIDYENASPLERAEMDRERAEREKLRIEDQIRSENQKLREQIEARDEQIETDRWHGLGENLLAKYNMSAYIDDPVRAEKLNNLVWKNVWNDMNELDIDQWTPRKLEMAFRETSSVLRGNLEKMTKDRVAATVEAKKNEATEQAQMAAKRNYAGNDSSKNNFVDEMKNSRSALDRLKMLANLR